MAKFNIVSNNKTYTINTDGTVSTVEGKFGTWNTNADNQLVIKKDGVNSSIKVDVDWKFNGSNQLVLQQGGQDLYNFHSGGARPRMRLSENVLQIRPSSDFSFEFALHSQWELDAKVNLKVTIGKASSVLDGWADDKKSRFIYWFRDKQAGTVAPYALEFSGSWERDTSAKNEIRMLFKYTAEGTRGQFSLPATAAVDTTRNHLYLEYEKNGLARRIEMRGSLEITKDFDLIFTISRQTNSTGGVVTQETQIKVETTFQINNLSGDLTLYVGKTVTGNTQKLTIGGAFKMNFGSTGLDLTFSYSKSSGPGQIAVVGIAFGGKFTWDSQNSSLVFNYELNGKQQSLSVSSNFLLGNVRTEIGLKITKDGRDYGVYGFLGLSW